MSETPATPEAATTPAAPVESAEATSAQATSGAERPSGLEAALKEQELSIRALFEAGVHYGHQPGRWNPLMRSYIFGERNGTHIIDLDQTLPLMQEAMEFLRDTTAAGGKVLFVGTKRQAQAPIMTEARRAGQYYVNNRWLGGMLTNWKTVKKSIDRYNQYLEVLDSEEKKAELSKKELASMMRQVEKYEKSLEGIRAMERVPDAIFVVDVGKEAIAVQEAKRLHIPIVAVVDTNCSPRDIDLVIPGNDDAIRAIDLYCTAAANACREGAAVHQAQLVAQKRDEPQAAAPEAGPKSVRRVVEIKQQPRRGRAPSSAGGGKSYSAGGSQREDAEPRSDTSPASSAASSTPSSAASSTPPSSASSTPASAAPSTPASTDSSTPPTASEEGEKKE
jgi:small subunit ribosomal protein S2